MTDNRANRTAYVMIFIGLSMVVSLLGSVLLAVYMLYLGAFIPWSIPFFAWTLAINICGYYLNKYFEDKIYEAPKPRRN
jgi:hypothetical protein